MLNKIINIQGIGLFHDSKGADKIQLQKRTLVHANNGRGKSTLASVMHSCATMDSQPIVERQTVDGSLEPAVNLLVNNKPVKYRDGIWTGLGNEIVVFDSNFIDENVHSGQEVTSTQRANLLDFALGSKAVKARNREIKARENEKSASQELKTLKNNLKVLLGDRMDPAVFRALEEVPDIENVIQEAKSKVSAQTRADEIRRLPLPSEVELPRIDLEKIFAVLNRTMDNIHHEATSKVKEHIDHLDRPHARDWLHQGLELTQNDQCPYCNQSIKGLELIDLYRTYFDEAYNELKEEVEVSFTQAKRSTSSDVIDVLKATRQQNNKFLETWQEYVPVGQVSGERDGLANSLLKNLDNLFDSLFALKFEALAEAHADNDDWKEMDRLWSDFVEIYSEENKVMRSHLKQIEDFKRSLDTNTADNLNSHLNRSQMIQLRYTPSTVALIEDIAKAEQSVEDMENEKGAAREDLNSLMHSTLSEFKDTINQHLGGLGADFQISELKHSYRGQSPRTEYQIKLRGQPIKLSGGVPTFATALSEGDKRTMAFAFFAASTLADSDLHNKIVIVDDPMSSLDSSRRHHTLEILLEISEKADQLIVLAHDQYFLREMRSMFHQSDRTQPVAELSIRRVNHNYSDFGPLDLDALCQSEYLRNYKKVAGFVDGNLNTPDDLANCAIALRPLLEGYLHRKFPQILPSNEMLGKVINHIDHSEQSSPLAWAKQHVSLLQTLNRYASQFHHDTKPDYERARSVDETELATQAAQVLQFIYQ